MQPIWCAAQLCDANVGVVVQKSDNRNQKSERAFVNPRRGHPLPVRGRKAPLKFLVAVITLVFSVSFFSPTCAYAVSILRDTETEQFLESQCAPLFRAAHLNPADIHIVLVNDPAINAYVAGGQNIFIYSGLLLYADNLDQVLGVIAHETGHIAGGHLLRMADQLESASRQAILTMILGVAAGVAAGNGSAGAAIAMSGQQLTMGNILRFSRQQESSADQAGLRFLAAAHLPTRGMPEFLGKLVDQELLPESRQSEYIRTHPLTRDRLDTVKAVIARNHNIAAPLPMLAADEFKRLQAKLLAYLDPRAALQKYDDTDQSMVGDYGRAVAHYRMGDYPQARLILKKLAAREPDNPYFTELDGQILYEMGNVTAAAHVLKATAAKLPDAALIQILYGQVLIAGGNYSAAMRPLERAVTLEADNAEAQHWLAIAYGKSGQEALAQLHLAEENLLQMNYQTAIGQAKNAQKSLPKDSPSAQRASDIIATAELERQHDKRNDRK